MKKFLTILGVVLIIVIAALFYFKESQSMDMPQGKSGAEAEALAMKMMKACNAEAWDQTRFVKWTFAGRNSYVWDRSESLFKLESGDHVVFMNTKDHSGKAFEGETELQGAEKQEAMDDAWANFCNDSYWLVAPMKVMDPGIDREIVDTDEGKALMVHYRSGGVTPGDSYLWYISEDVLPYSYRMWTQDPPLTGIKASCEGWKTIHTGAKISTSHKLGPVELVMTDLVTGSTLEEIGFSNELFQ